MRSIFESKKSVNGVQLTSDQTFGGTWTLKADYEGEEYTFIHTRNEDSDVLKRVSWESVDLPETVVRVLLGEGFALH
jgi:hypothetical protein